MKKIIYTALAGYLNAGMNTPAMIAKYGATNYISSHNNQFNDDALEGAIPKPALALAFTEIDWVNKGHNQQQGQMTISVYVAYATIADPNFFETDSNQEAFKRWEYLQDVQLLLQGFNMGAAGTLQRTREVEDDNHDHITIDRIDYLTVVHDELADPSLQYVEITPEWKIIYKKPTDRPLPPDDGGYVLHGHI